MDFSGVLLIPLAAVTTAAWIIGAAALKRAATLRPPFLLAYGFGVIFMQPWLIASWQQAGMFIVMLVMLALWIAAGCLLGAMPAMAAVALVRRLARSEQ